MKKYIITLLCLVICGTAQAANTPPPGASGNIIINKNGSQYGGVAPGVGLNLTATALNVTVTGGGTPGGPTGSVQYNNGGNTFAGLLSGTIWGISGTITPFFNAANLLYQVSQGMILDPRYYGAACNGTLVTGAYTNTNRYVTTTQGSNLIGAVGFTWQAGTAGPGYGGDAGKIISIFGRQGSSLYDVGPTTYISAIDSTTTAEVGGSSASWAASASTTNSYAVYGGYPSDFSTPSLAEDDAQYINNTSNESAIFHGGKIILPTNCTAGRGSINSSTYTPIALHSGTALWGNSGATNYSSGGTPLSPGNAVTVLYFDGNTYAEDPHMAVNIGSCSNCSYHNFTVEAAGYPYLPQGGMQAAAFGTTNAMALYMQTAWLDNVSASVFPVGLGTPFGYNIPVSFTVAPTSTNQLNVLAITSTTMAQTYNPYGIGTVAPSSDFISWGLKITGTGIPSNTTITAAAPQGGTGLYTTSTALAITSTETVTTVNPNIFMGLYTTNSLFATNAIGINGDCSDCSFINTWTSGSWDYGIYMGPWASAAGNGLVVIDGGRGEEDGGVASIMLDGAFDSQIDNRQFQFNWGYSIATQDSLHSHQNAHILLANDFFEGSDGNGFVPKSHILIDANTNHFAIDNASADYTNIFTGNVPTSLFATGTGCLTTTCDYVFVDGGDVSQGYHGTGSYIYDFSVGGAISHLRLNTAVIPFLDTTQPITIGGALGLSSTNANGGANFYTNLSTTTTTSGNVTISGLSPVKNQYDCSGGNGTTRLNFSRVLASTTSTSAALAITTTVSSGDEIWLKCPGGN